MHWLVDLKSNEWQREKVGGKAFHLAEMARWGLEVPPFGAVTTDAYRVWKEAGTLPDGMPAAIAADLKIWGGEFFAVRSSMTREDGDTASFAGILESYLFVKPHEVVEKVIECFRSIDADRAQMYLKQKDLFDPSKIGVAVVVQKMIASVCSGVAFSRSPKLSSCLVYIEAGLGLGEGIVSGHVEVDSYWLDRFGRDCRIEARPKSTRLHYDPKQHKVIKTEAPTADPKPCMASQHRTELAKIVIEIERRFQKPSDVEWAVGPDDKLYILQARAITQPFTPVEYFSDTNLAESYPGTVSPLTASFVPRAYTKVIGEGIEYLGAGSESMAALRPYLETLIANFEGHLYYRLSSYYSMLAFMPGGKKNLEGWHKMIGGDTGSDFEWRFIDPSPAEKLKMAAKMLQLVAFHDAIFLNFIDDAFKELGRFERELEQLPHSRAVAANFDRLMRDVKDWGLTILNDFVVIIGLKAIDSFTKRYGLDEKKLPELLRTEKGVDSLRALEELTKLANHLRESDGFMALRPRIRELLDRDGGTEELLELLRSRKLETEAALFETYLGEFGERAFEELKLECMTFGQSPDEFFKVLDWYLANPNAQDASAGKKKPTVSKDDVMRAELAKLPIYLRPVFRKVVGMAEKGVQARESTRLMRGRYYNLMRSTALRWGKLVKAERPHLFGDCVKRDFFSLSLDDFAEYAAGRLGPEQAHALIVARRGWQNEKREYPEFMCHSAQDTKTTFELGNSSDMAEHALASVAADGRMIGMGAAPGVIRAKALVLKDPREALGVADLSERILVTQSTDPAWIFIMSQCRGLVSEKGSLLSHTAIVGRELKIPTVVGVSQATRLIKTGEMIEINGDEGTISRV